MAFVSVEKAMNDAVTAYDANELYIQMLTIALKEAREKKNVIHRKTQTLAMNLFREAVKKAKGNFKANDKANSFKKKTLLSKKGVRFEKPRLDTAELEAVLACGPTPPARDSLIAAEVAARATRFAENIINQLDYYDDDDDF